MQFEKINKNKMINNSALTNDSQNINKSKEQNLNELFKELQLKYNPGLKEKDNNVDSQIELYDNDSKL